METYHRVQGVRTNDLQFDLSLQDGHLIKTRVFARPGLIQDTLVMLREVHASTWVLSPRTQERLFNELGLRSGLMSVTFDELTAPLITMVHHNDYYLGDAWEYAKVVHIQLG